MLINCDMGERGPAHPGDLRLLEAVHIANIACGGHAGDAQSARVLLARCIALSPWCCNRDRPLAAGARRP